MLSKSGRKFIALTVCLIIIVLTFIFLTTGVLVEPRGKEFFAKFCDFTLFIYVAYVSGNGIEHISRKIERRSSVRSSEVEP